MLVCPKCRSTYTRHQEHCGLDGTKLVRADADPLIGQIIDKYRIDQRLGSGGMATVYRARHQFLDKDYAVKVLHGQIAADSTMARRFHREAKTLGQIKHPNVVSVDNFGVTSAGLLYMVMEYLNGATLGQVLRKNGPFAPARAAEIVRQIATGLQAAHRKGFVHRDLKPGNVMLIVADEVDSESVKLMDFGLVRILSDDTNTQLTQEGQFFGTPMYMAPEQIAGTEVGPATDLYALGVLLYQMLSGKPPFTGDIKRLAFQHVQTPPPALASPYGGLSDLSRDLMAKMVERRPADAQVVIDRIDEMALTPASKPLGEVAQDFSDALKDDAEPQIEATILYGSDDAEAPLSRPILQEERAFRTQHEADADLLRASINEALGRRRTGWVWMLLFAVIGGAATVYFLNDGRLDNLQRLIPGLQSANQAEASSAADHSGTATLGPAPTDAKTTNPQTPPADAKAAAAKTLPEGKAPAGDAGRPKPSDGAKAPSLAKTEPSTASPDTPMYSGPPRPFIQLDDLLDHHLEDRGLLLEDLAPIDAVAAERWRQWRERLEADGMDARLPRRRAENVFARLQTLADRLDINDDLINAKVMRIDKDISVLKAFGGQIEPMQRRLANARRALRKKSPRLESIAKVLGKLERDVLHETDHAEPFDTIAPDAAEEPPTPQSAEDNDAPKPAASSDTTSNNVGESNNPASTSPASTSTTSKAP